MAHRIDIPAESIGAGARAIHAPAALERLRLEQERELSIEFFRLVNASDSVGGLIDAAVHFFQQHSLCQAVAVRLRHGSDFPYFHAMGFSDDFLQGENKLALYECFGETTGKFIGTANLECRCGDVISGRYDAEQPFFTARGSFWTNDADEPCPASRPLFSRSGCNRHGYRSIALIALNAGKDRIGLLQMNDKRAGRFTREDIFFWEGLANHLAVALARFIAEETLRSNEEHLRSLFGGVSDELAVHEITPGGGAGRFLEVNDVICRRLGYSREEMLSMSPCDIEDPASEISAATLSVRLAVSGDLIFEQIHRAKNGSRIPVEVHARRFVLRGRPAVITLARDLTVRKQAEEQIKALEEQFRHAQKMEAVGRLAGGIAHDFNNLLMVIRSYTEILEDELASMDSTRRKTQAILNATDRAASLTLQMLAFSRKQMLSPVPLDLNESVAESAKMLERIIGEHIELRVHPAASLWTVRADRDQIAQVIMNLCINSRDAMPGGGILTLATRNLTVGPGIVDCHPFMAPGNYAVFSVTDTGTGISKDVQERMFEPFFTTKSVGKGTGLGLSTVYGIVKQSGGYLLCDSEPGRGASFSVYLPSLEHNSADARESMARALPRGSETLLLIEDDDLLRESIRQSLAGLGYNVLAAGSGQRALAIAHQCKHPIDLMITDVVMPRVNGRELLQMLENIHPAMKTVFMSRYIDDAMVRHGIPLEGVAFLQKPFSLDVLAHKLRELLGNLPGDESPAPYSEL